MNWPARVTRPLSLCLLLTTPWLAACRGGGSSDEPALNNERGDPSSYDGTTMGDQERDHDVTGGGRRARTPQLTGHPTDESDPNRRRPAPRDVGSARGSGGSEQGTTGEFGGPARGAGGSQ